MVACLFIPIYAGPVYHTLNAYVFVALCYNEMVSMHRNENKDNLNSLTGPKIEWLLYFLGLFYQAPRLVFRR